MVNSGQGTQWTRYIVDMVHSGQGTLSGHGTQWTRYTVDMVHSGHGT